MPESPVPRRVQVVPLGFEDARLRRPIEEWRADKVVAVEYADGDADIPYLADLLAELDADDRIGLERRSCDIFDLYEALGTIAAAIDDHPDDDVYVNLSAGSKITAVAGMIACMATGATPLYARPDYGPDAERVPPEPLHDAVAETFALPAYPIDRPSDALLSFMRHIDETGDGTGRYRGVSKKDLVAFGREREVRAFAASEAETEKGYYRLLDRHVVRPLQERGYVDVEQVGRRKYVSLTETGENALRAFGHLA